MWAGWDIAQAVVILGVSTTFNPKDTLAYYIPLGDNLKKV